MFGLQIIFSDHAVQRVPRSDRKSYRKSRPRYGVRRKQVAKPSLRPFVSRAFLWRAVAVARRA